MSRRRRNKPAKTSAQPARRRPPAQRDHMARVHTSDEVWQQFKTAAGNEPISVILDQFVARYADRDQARRLRAGTLDDHELLNALERARELHADLAQIVGQLQRRARRRDQQHAAEAAGADDRRLSLDLDW